MVLIYLHKFYTDDGRPQDRKYSEMIFARNTLSLRYFTQPNAAPDIMNILTTHCFKITSNMNICV